MKTIPFGIKGYELTEATAEDREFLIESMRESILSSVTEEERSLSGLWIDDILSVSSANIEGHAMDSEVFKLTGQEGYVGMLWMGISRDQFTCDQTGYLLNIYVRKEHRGKGLGKELLRCAEKWCGMKGLLSMTLNVGSGNSAAMDLYRSAGYKSQSVVMRKMLGN